jgi:hypothetical protein
MIIALFQGFFVLNLEAQLVVSFILLEVGGGCVLDWIALRV